MRNATCNKDSLYITNHFANSTDLGKYSLKLISRYAMLITYLKVTKMVMRSTGSKV